MEYRVAAFKCKINSVIALEDDMIPVGAVYIGADLFIVCLDPLEERKLSEAKLEEEEEEKVGAEPEAEDEPKIESTEEDTGSGDGKPEEEPVHDN